MTELLITEVKPRPMKYRVVQLTKKNAAEIAAYLREYYEDKNITVRSGGGWVKAKFDSPSHDVPVEVTATVSDCIVIGPRGGLEVVNTEHLWALFAPWKK